MNLWADSKGVEIIVRRHWAVLAVGTMMLAGCTQTKQVADIDFRQPTGHYRKTGDAEIAKRIVDILAWNALVPEDKITVQVEHGSVTLAGTVDWHYQRDAAREAAGKTTGVTGISNLIAVRQSPVATDVRQRILNAFERQANRDATGITVVTDGGKVRLSGMVKAYYERGIAERAAWAAPGVTEIEDNIIVA